MSKAALFVLPFLAGGGVGFIVAFELQKKRLREIGSTIKSYTSSVTAFQSYVDGTEVVIPVEKIQDEVEWIVNKELGK